MDREPLSWGTRLGVAATYLLATVFCLVVDVRLLGLVLGGIMLLGLLGASIWTAIESSRHRSKYRRALEQVQPPPPPLASTPRRFRWHLRDILIALPLLFWELP